VGFWVREASRALSRVLQDEFAAHEVTTPQFFYLRALWEGDGVSQMEISQRLGVDRATATIVLASMERGGLIERHRDADDLRRINVYLTERGAALKTPLLRAANRVNAIATEGFEPAEAATLKELLQRLVGNLNTGG
jgi:DNA-binding MarR family transcriptional regulator